jgi:DNA helicase-2/ATP-dependent DNA helicase PcrA
MTTQSIPILDGDALRAVRHRGSHMQIIACAGSGKTEVVAQRVADLLADGADARSIIAFTFTERAAEELKARISARVEQRLGTKALDKLGAAFVGTIHAYCFRFLQQYVPKYETYDVLDERRLTAFLCRVERTLDLRSLTGRQFASIKTFLSNLDVVQNELLAVESLKGAFGEMVVKFYGLLDQFRLLTYGQLIARAVEELSKIEVRQAVQATLRYLIVDEYQDVNPAQEELIRQLTEGGLTELCVVGDDDQAIYQWRGSDVRNIVEFDKRYPAVAKFQISANRRSLPSIVIAAATFARSIPGRLEKEMSPVREPARTEIVTWSAESEADECDIIAQTIQRLHDEGLAYRDIAVLVRGRVAYGALLDAFDTYGVPVQPGGRTGLFTRPEAQLFGKTYTWLVDYGWSDSGYGQRLPPTDNEIFAGYTSIYGLSAERAAVVRTHLLTLKVNVPTDDRPVNLVGDFYELLAELGAREWDPDDPMTGARLGTLARCSAILADYESVRRRSRPDPNEPGTQRGGTDRGEWYYRNLATYITNYAQGAYEDFDGEPDVQVDAVDLTTVHKAKGLEWRVVFVPSLTKRRFPSSMTGRQRTDWMVPLHLFNRVRYEGSDVDERRLFYVAMTRARDWASLSRHERTAKNKVTASPYHDEIRGFAATHPLPLPNVERIVREETEEPLTLTFSELAAYRSCGFAYRLRSMLGFQPFLAPELGYGKAVHHLMRAIAEHTRMYGHPPDAVELDRLFDDGFFLPAASKPAHNQLKKAARRLVNRYLATYQDDLYRVWETERPFELHLPTAIVNGRADVILDSEGGEVMALAIVDYKTSVDSADGVAEYALQLAVYADAGRREGLNVRAAYVHDLKDAVREPVDVTPTAIVAAEAQVESAVRGLRNREFQARPGRPCRRCDLHKLCRWEVS